jgi:hypothetical protein
MWYNVDRIQRIKIDSRDPLQVGIELSEINLPITFTGPDADIFVKEMRRQFGIDLLKPVKIEEIKNSMDHLLKGWDHEDNNK